MQPLVSIIVPSYNHSLYIEQTLQSIESNTYNNIEVLIIDDGSSDLSVNIINDWISNTKIENSRINFTARENKGVVNTLNELIDMAQGKYIFILASDDLIVANSLQELVVYCEKHCDSKSVLFSNMTFIDNEGNELGDVYLDCQKSMLKTGKSKYILAQMLLHWRPPFNLPFFSKASFRSVCGRYSNKYNFEDFYLALKYFNKGNIHYIDTPSHCYRVFDDKRGQVRSYHKGMQTMLDDSILESVGIKSIILKLVRNCYSDRKFISVSAKVVRELILSFIKLFSKINVR